MNEPEPAAGPADQASVWETRERSWFFEHYEQAAQEAIDFLREGGISLGGRRVADVGCGDGLIDLGLVHRGAPDRLVGFDIVPTNEDGLLERARRFGVAEKLPRELEFVTSEGTRLPAKPGSFDVVVSWSAFEHVGEPVGLLTEIRRILRPTGVLFLQLWPFFRSERGSHLWDWFPQGFHHLIQSDDEIARAMTDRPLQGEDYTRYMLNEYRNLNRITVDELQRAMLAGGLCIRRFELLTHLVELPPQAQRYPLSELGIAGIKLLATPLP